jgi:hypothetical protein
VKVGCEKVVPYNEALQLRRSGGASMGGDPERLSRRANGRILGDIGS